MNDKDLLKKIRQEASQIEPDLTTFLHERFGPPTLKKKKTSVWNLLPSATLVVGFFIMGILIGSFTPLSLPSSPSTTSSISDSTTTSIVSETPSSIPSSEPALPPLRLESDKDALSVSTITTATLFNNLTTPTPAPLPRFTYHSNNRPTYSFDETMSLVRPYLGLFEQLLGQASAPEVITETLVDQPFQYVDRFVAFDIQGLPINYALFYNLSDVETINDELYYSLAGELTINEGTPLLVSGSKVMDGDETILSFKAETDTNNYLESIYKYEEDETKIRIRQMKEGILQVNLFKLELDDDETEIELLFLEENDEKRVRDEFKFEYETEDGENILKISFSVATDEGQVKGKIKVLVVEILDENNQIIGYEYLAYELDDEGNETSEWRDHRDRHDDQNDDDDDDDDDED